MAHSKEEEVFNMLVKTNKVFDLKEVKHLEKLGHISLADFNLGIVIPSTLFIRLPSYLRPYKQLKMKYGFVIDWKKSSTAH